MTLEEASLAKLERICEKLDLGPGDRRAGDRHGLGRLRRPRREHPRLPRHDHDDLPRAARLRRSSRSGAAGLEDRVDGAAPRTTATCAGRYDKLVSIEMIEAVGWQHFGTFFAQCSRPAGARRGDAAAGDHDRRPRLRGREGLAESFINTHIFPGGCLPSLEVIARCVARRTDMQHRAARGSHAALRRDAPPLARTTSSPTPTRARASSATTSASSGCGRSTSPTARRASPSGGSATSSCCWPSRSGAAG